MSVETLPLRPYQQRVIDKLYGAYGGGRRRVPIVMPTGGGKTHVFSHVATDVLAAGGTVLALAHRRELIDQAVEKLADATSGLDVGVLQGTRREVHRRVVVSSMLTAVQPGALSLLKARPPALVIVDECHHIAAPSYQTILRELGVFGDSGPRLLGVTATLGRNDGLALGDTFDGDPAEVVEIGELIRDGYLLPPRGIRVKVDGLDISAVRSSRTSDSGLDDKGVAQAMSDALAPAAVARAVLEHCAGRKGVAFMPSVELSKEQARVFCEHGLKAIHVDGTTPKAVRKEIFRRARLGEYDVVCNVGVATEGTDVPIWSFAVLGRLTSSEGLYQQMAGRPMRLYPGQTDCILLDVVGVTGRHRIRSWVDLAGAEAIEDLPDDLLGYEPDDEEDLEHGLGDPNKTSSDSELPAGADGPLAYELIDLFSASHTAWQRSPRGVWFLPAGAGRAVLLAPSAEVDEYDVIWSGGELITLAHPISTAMAWGEKAAKERADRPIERGASWRVERLTRQQRMEAIYRGEAPGGADAPRTAGALAEHQGAAWARTAIDTLPEVAQVSPAGYWTT